MTECCSECGRPFEEPDPDRAIISGPNVVAIKKMITNVVMQDKKSKLQFEIEGGEFTTMADAPAKNIAGHGLAPIRSAARSSVRITAGTGAIPDFGGFVGVVEAMREPIVHVDVLRNGEEYFASTVHGADVIELDAFPGIGGEEDQFELTISAPIGRWVDRRL